MPNDYPYVGTVQHFLLVPREHVSALTELSGDSQLGFWNALEYVARTYNLEYYGLACRNGDMRFSGATIAHLHIHVIVGDPANEGPAVAVYLSSVPSTNSSPA